MKKTERAIVIYASRQAMVDDAFILVKSLRRFGGRESGLPVLLMLDPAAGLDTSRLEGLGVETVLIDAAPVEPAFPFARKVQACAAAEALLDGVAGELLYLDAEMLVLGGLEAYAIPAAKDVLLRPVMLMNAVGQDPAKPLDAYWRALYDDLGSGGDAAPPVRTLVDEREARFYVNCEAIAVRPALGLFRLWEEVFLRRLRDAAYMAAECPPDGNRRFFLHQAALSAVIASRVPSERMAWMEGGGPYSLHLHARMPAARRIASLGETAMLGYDLAYSGSPAILGLGPFDEPFRSWLVAEEAAMRMLAPGVYVEEGEANSGLVETGGGVVLIDPSAGEGGSWLALAFADRKVEAVLFTHAHGDHRSGLGLWPAAAAAPKIAQREWGRTAGYLHALGPFFARRNALFARGDPAAPLPPRAFEPDETFADGLSRDFSGLAVEMIHAPSETSDASLVWLPGSRTLFAGDAFFSSFPMLGTPRGSMPRLALDYAASLDAMIALGPETLVPGHGPALRGKAAVEAALRRYRSALLYVHDAVVEGLNAGASEDALAAAITLPLGLALPEAFGKVAWAVRSIYRNYAGWWGGDPLQLLPGCAESAQAELAALCGVEVVAARAEALMAEGRVPDAIRMAAAGLLADPANARLLALCQAGYGTLLASSANWGERNLFRAELARIEALLA